ncbi:uncharacterized protein LOC121776688 [Salvia splendens]|uniref:uncharacterized protein LOC121776688 n=1 Tax=Salvia splendens TaxID=180675 RepID=UPI001C25725B|nr:uncharacterized protein LOC121776688 [Salvia splendens]
MDFFVFRAQGFKQLFHEFYMQDIIGVVVDTGKIVTYSTSKLIEIRLSDSDHNMLFCTLWGDVDSYLQQLERIKGKMPIIIVQFCKPTLLRGTIRVSTHFNTSRVYINQDIDEISNFKERISGDIAFLSQESIYRFTDTRVSNEFDGLVVKTLADVQEDVVVKIKNEFNCEKCDNSDGIAIPRFLFIMNVVDGSSNASLLLWDRECVQLLGKKVDEIQLGHEEFAGTDVVLHGSTSSTNDTHTKLIAKESLKRSLDVEILGQTIVVGGEQKKLMIKQEKN